MNATAYTGTLNLFDAKPAAKFPTPRAFQDKTHAALRTGVMEGHQCQVVMAPTGAGKTFIGLRICEETLRRNKRVMFICDRKTLIDQTNEKAAEYGMQAPGIIQADHPRFDLTRPFQIASAQTLAVRGVTDDFEVIVVDECHTLHDSTTELIKKTKAKVIGLSATPFTKGLGAIYSRLVNAATMKELVDLGVLVPMRVRSCARPDMKGAKTNAAGEWTSKEAEQRGMGLVGDVVSEWVTHAENRKTIVFGSSIVHCESLLEQFQGAGIGAALFTGHTKDNERKELLAEFKKADSKIRVLISVEALAKGFDVPDVGCVCDCRPLRKSLSTFVQLVGRGLRSFPGKVECLLLDFSGNVIRFAEDFSDLYFNGLADLDSGVRLDREVRKDVDEKTVAACPNCGFKPLGKRCVKCGFGAKSVSLVEHDEGKSKELDLLRQRAEKQAALMLSYGKNDAEIYAAIATHEKGRSAARVEAGKPIGNPQGATWHRFFEITGRRPVEFDFATAPHLVPSRALQGKLQQLTIAYARARRSSK